MPTKPGPGRYVLAAFLLALEAPMVLTLALCAALTRALLGAGRAAQLLARLSPALVMGGNRGRQSSERARSATRLGHQS